MVHIIRWSCLMVFIVFTHQINAQNQYAAPNVTTEHPLKIFGPDPILELKIVGHSGGALEPLFLHMELICPSNENIEGYPIVGSEQRPISFTSLF